MRRAVALLAVMVMVVGGCGDDPAGTTRRVPLSANDGGTTVEVSVGDELLIDLEANPSTGFTWTHERSDSAILVPVGEPELVETTGLVGAAGILTWTFEAVGVGATELELAYRRPFEAGVDPERWWMVVVIVADE